MPTTKIWKDVPGFEKYYSLSQDGELFSKRRKIILRWQNHPAGYFQVGVSIDKKIHHFLLHRLLLTTFVSIPSSELPWALHRDGNCKNNKLENLYWGTPIQNTSDSLRHKVLPVGEKVKNAKLTNQIVTEIRLDIRNGHSYNYVKTKYGISLGNIHKIAHRKSWRHVE